MKKYDRFATSVGFNKVSNGYVKDVEGFKLYFKDWQYLVLNIPSFYIPVNKKLTKEVVNKISKALFDTACAIYPLNNEVDALIVSLPEGKKDSEKWKLLTINQTIESVKILKSEGYEPLRVCPLCSKEAEYDFLGDNYVPVHNECKEEYLSKLEKKSDEENKKIYLNLIGLLISLLCSVIGIVPAFFLGYFTHDFFTPLVALVPIFNALGYFLFKAPNKKWYRYCLSIIPLLIIVPFEIFIMPHMAEGKDLTLFNYCFTNGWVGFRKYLFMNIFALGGFGTIKFVSKYKVDIEKEIKKIKK